MRTTKVSRGTKASWKRNVCKISVYNKNGTLLFIIELNIIFEYLKVFYYVLYIVK